MKMMIAAKLGIVAIVLVVTFAIMYVIPKIFHFQKHENFISSTQLIMEAQKQQGMLSAANLRALDETFNRMNGVDGLDDSTRLMQAVRCYQVGTGTIDTRTMNIIVGSSVYAVNFTGMFASLSQIEDKIVQELIKFKDSIGDEIKGNVYVYIGQVPYYKNERGNAIHAGYYLDNKTDYMPSTMNREIFYSVAVVFANYRADKTYIANSVFEANMRTLDATSASNDKQCFIKCISSDTMCGCISSPTGVYKDDPNYSIKCYGRDRSGNQTEVVTYLALYRINKRYAWVEKFFKKS